MTTYKILDADNGYLTIRFVADDGRRQIIEVFHDPTMPLDNFIAAVNPFKPVMKVEVPADLVGKGGEAKDFPKPIPTREGPPPPDRQPGLPPPDTE